MQLHLFFQHVRQHTLFIAINRYQLDIKLLCKGYEIRIGIGVGGNFISGSKQG